MPQPALKTAKSERTRERLVEATLAELCETGSFSAESIAKRAEISPATYYVYFPSKEIALGAAFSTALQRLENVATSTFTIENLLGLGLKPTCARVVEDSVSYFREHQLIFRTALAELPTSKIIRDAFRGSENEVLEHFRKVVEMGQRAGTIAPGRPETLAEAVLVLTQGLNNNLLLKRNNADLRELLVRSLLGVLDPKANAAP